MMQRTAIDTSPNTTGEGDPRPAGGRSPLGTAPILTTDQHSATCSNRRPLLDDERPKLGYCPECRTSFWLPADLAARVPGPRSAAVSAPDEQPRVARRRRPKVTPRPVSVPPCPEWCTLDDGHGSDHPAPDGTVRRFHRGPQWELVPGRLVVEFEQFETVQGTDVYRDQAEAVTIDLAAEDAALAAVAPGAGQ